MQNPEKSTAADSQKKTPKAADINLGSTDESGTPTKGMVENSNQGKSERCVTVGICKHKLIDKGGVAIEVGDYNKKQSCYFCKTQFSKIIRHLESAHAEEDGVKVLRSMEKKSKGREKQAVKLRNMGNY